MAKLFVTNCTKQNQDFIYRIPEDKKLRMQQIPPGGQVRIHNEAPLDVLDAIVKQHHQYGLIPASEIDQTRDFIGLCYSFDKPIEVDKILQADEHNQDVLIARGQEVRETTLATLNDQMAALGDGAELVNLETEIIQDTKTGHKSGRVDEVMQIDRPGREPNKRIKQRRKSGT